MDGVNKNFNVPFYIFEEITQYLELTTQEYCKSAKWNNIKSLLRLAEVNNRLSSEQINFIIEKYCRE